ncbi:MAG: nitrate reductase molybdenum cofactor assembly chaperone [Baekduia sp.]
MRRRKAEVARKSWEIAAALLRYPDENIHEALPQIAFAAAELPGASGDAVAALARRWHERTVLDLQREYVEVFDLDRRAALHLSYHQYGDRRQRGVVLLGLKRKLEEHGFTAAGEELPDWLPLLLEFAARAPEGAGLDLLEQWRAPIELIRRRLSERGHEHAVILDLVSGTLGSLGRNAERAVERLLAEGPPEEEVGLEPFGPESDLGLLESDLRPGADAPIGVLR